MSGPGGAGKGTIARILGERDSSGWLSRSWTTRAPRPGGTGDDYVFVDRAAFEAKIANSGFLEWAEFQGNYYGTPMPDSPPGADVLLEIDVQGARSVQEIDEGALLIFVDAPDDEELARRLRRRGDREETVEHRLQEAERERERAAELGSIRVVNDDLDQAVAEIANLIEEHRRRR